MYPERMVALPAADASGDAIVEAATSALPHAIASSRVAAQSPPLGPVPRE